MRCCTAPSSSAISTSARSAATTCASGARERLERFLDPGTSEEIGAGIAPEDPLKFRDSKRYRDRLAQAQKATGESDALIVLAGTLHALPVVACAFEFQFLGGSMGSVVGERFKRGGRLLHPGSAGRSCASPPAAARACRRRCIRCCRWRRPAPRWRAWRRPTCRSSRCMTDPTTGGVSASLAMLGDLNLAEPRALIGFAGPRVIQQTVRETLPEGFQRSEFLLEHGALDLIVDRRDMRDRIARPAAPAAEAPGRRRRLTRAAMRTLAEWLALQESVHPKSIDLDLTRVAAVARTLGVAEPAFAVLTVGGTNGKGSIAAHLEALLRGARRAHRAVHLAAPHALQRAHPPRRRARSTTPR